MQPALRNAVMTTTATAVPLGGIAVTATPASTVGSSRCNRNDKNHSVIGPNLEWLAICTGPGVAYKKEGQLDPAGKFYVPCSAKNKHSNRWHYGESLSSGSYGMKGWVPGS
ncbi:hypothetical protein [Streptomyces sp. NPDC056160]|uniref:hypothetical protein n=1 Tax=Streptomyces sp. NPDC056160 TaxID=3345731 RepID=UPI0035D6F6F8